jgi:hypothetical protein
LHLLLEKLPAADEFLDFVTADAALDRIAKKSEPETLLSLGQGTA